MHLFFDLDGTLTDSCTGIIRCVNHALEGLGRAREPDERLRAMIGRPLTDIFGTVMTSSDEAAIDRAIVLYRARFDDIGIFENALCPGVPEALSRLRAAGHRLQVVTAKPAPAAVRVLAHFGIDHHFEVVHGPALADRGCDKGRLLGRALAQADVRADAAVMIGDRADDVLAASAHGVRAVGAGWGYGSRRELTDAGAIYIAADMEDLVAHLLE